MAALGALGQLTGPVALNARLMVLYDGKSSDALIARALPPLGRGRALPTNDLVGFLDHQSAIVRAAALGAFPPDRPLGKDVSEALIRLADDPAPEVRAAFVAAAGAYKLRAALPKLIALATDPDPALRAEATRSLAAIPDRRALPAFAAALNDRDPELRRVGLTGLTAIRAEVIPDLTALAGQGAFHGPGALAVERLLATFHPLTDWRVIGPFPRATGPIFADARALDFARPASGVDGQPVAWQSRRGDAVTGVVSLDDLAQSATGPDARPLTAFAVAEVPSDRDRAALLTIDATGPTLVTLGDRVLANFATGPTSETVRVDLKSGLNRLLFRTRQSSPTWSIRVALADLMTQTAAGSSLAARPVSIPRAGLRTFALKVAGDPKNGAAIFNQPGGISCNRCHGVGAALAALPGLGPNLDGLALKYDKAEIIRSVLEPSSRIAVGSAPVVVARRDGTSVTGLLARETASTLELITADGQHVAVARSQISQQTSGTVSIMPEGLVDGLSPVEFADLIAYLMSLKTGAGGGKVAR